MNKLIFYYILLNSVTFGRYIYLRGTKIMILTKQGNY